MDRCISRILWLKEMYTVGVITQFDYIDELQKIGRREGFTFDPISKELKDFLSKFQEEGAE